MRIMNKFSIAFYVVDSLTKNPIQGAAIEHNGKIPMAHIYRPDGYYVFKNMPRENYTFTIRAKGYQTRTFDVSLIDNENLDYKVKTDDPSGEEALVVEDLGVILCSMNYSSQRRSLIPQPYAMIKKDGKALANSWVQVVLDSKLTDMRVAKTVNEGADRITVNGGYFTKYVYQQYIATAEPKPINVVGYDFEKESYITKYPLTKKLKIGSLLKPVWMLKTDNEGKVFLPVSAQFFFDKTLDFTVKHEDVSKKIKVDPSNNRTPYDIDF